MRHLFVIALVAVVAVVAQQTKGKITTFEKVPLGSTVLETGTEVITSFPKLSAKDKFTIPPDNGGNYGDNLWGARTTIDSILLQQILINDIQNGDSQWKWTAKIDGFYITHIRFLNIGRQRAYVSSITSPDHKSITAVIQMFAKQQFRIMVEVYGFIKV